MAKRFRSLSVLFRDCLKKIFARPRKRERGGYNYRPFLENLETRITPATFTENTGGHILTVTLDGVNESVAFAATASGTYTATFTNGLAESGGIGASRVSGFGTSVATITPAGVAFYNAIDVVDLSSGDAVSFTNSSANAYTAAFNVNLSNPLAGGISFSGASDFVNGLTAQTTIGNITSAAGSAITVASSGLSLTTSSNINLAGSVNVTSGNATLSAGLSITSTAAFAGGSDANLTASNGSISTAAISASSDVTLTATNGNITATGTLTAGNESTLSATGNITLGSALGGAVADTSYTQLEANGAITAINPGNNFGSNFLEFFGANGYGSAGSANVVSAGALTFSTVNITGSLTAKAGGAISQNVAISVGGDVSFTTTTGAISLDSYNNFGGDISAKVNPAGSDNITLGNYNSDIGNFEIGTITMGSGVLQLDNYASGYDGNPSVTEDPAGGGITNATSGTIIVNVTNAASFGADVAVLLTSSLNNISPGAGAVTINGYFLGTFGDLGYSNSNAGASPNDLTLNNFSVNNLTLEFSGNSTALDISNLPAQLAYSNNLTILNQGDINEVTNGPITVNGDASFTSTAGSVLLDTSGNTFFGDISASVLNANNITLENSNSFTTWWTISLGKGTLTVNDDDSSGFSEITEDPSDAGITITGTGTGVTTPSAIFNITADASANVLLGEAANNIAGTATVSVNGVLLTGTSGDFAFRNTNANATLSKVTVNTGINPFTINNLTVEFDAAAIDVHNLPAFSSSDNLSVTAGGTGISQSAGTLSAASASFAVMGVGNPSISLTKNNAIPGAVSFTTPTTDTGSVSFTNSGAIVLGSSTLGSGAFNVTAATGNITEPSGTITQAAGATANFTATTGTIIDLSTGTDNVFTGQVTFGGTHISTAGLENSYVKATFGSLAVTSGITSNGSETLIFDNPLTSIVLPNLTGIAYSVNLTAGDNIVSLPTQTFGLTGSSNNLSLTSQNGNINLVGTLSVVGTTTLEVDGFGPTPSITATNPSNNFGASLSLNPSHGGVAFINVVSAAGLVLAASSTAGGSLSATALAGAITQTGVLSLYGAASFAATGGNITLNNAANVFASDLSASVSGGNSISLFNDSPTTTLGTISLGSASTLGTLTVDDVYAGGSSSINEDPSAGGIVMVPTSNTPTTANFTVNNATGTIDLSGAANNFGPNVTVNINGIAGPTSGGFGFRNTNPAATLAKVTFNNFSITTFLTVQFDNTSLDVHSLPTYGNSVALTLTAGGLITESAGSAVTAASGSFNGLGNFGITLTNANHIAGPVSFSDPNGDNLANVAFTNAGNILLGSSIGPNNVLSNLGLGRFTVISNTGSITEQNGDSIVQAVGGGAVVFEAGGATIDLSAGENNDFSGPVTFTGSGVGNVTTIGFENADPLATLPTLTVGGFAAPLTSVTYTLDNAPINLSSINTASLSVTAGGNISQTLGTTLTVTGNAFFNAAARRDP